MPLPWKKTKGNRISRIVADLQPPKRGGSLLVETGFPTSVIDLFVKNRERMKRQSSKRKSTKEFDPDIFESVAPPPTPLLSPDHSLVFPSEEARGMVVDANCSGGGILGNLEGESAPIGVEERVGGGANWNVVFVVAMKMFLVVVLALSTKKLAVGITLSSFLLLLLLLEFSGGFAAGFFKPCSDAHLGMSRWIRKIYGWFLSERKNSGESKRIAEHEGEWTKRNDDGAITCELMDGEEESNASSEEIQILEPNFITSSYAIGNQGLQHDFLSREKRWGYVDVEREEEENEEQGKLRESKNQRRKSAKLKAKIIKKLIPKKLRSAKKLVKINKVENKMEYCSEGLGSHMENDVGFREEQDEQENENGSVSSGEEEEEDDSNGVSGVHESWPAAEMRMMGKRAEGRNGLECIFLTVMILSGLLGGRFLALVLTVSGCFGFKLIKILNQKWKLG